MGTRWHVARHIKVLCALVFLSSGLQTAAYSETDAAPVYRLSWDGRSTILTVDISYRATAGKTSFSFVNDIGNSKSIFKKLYHIKVDGGGTFEIDSAKRSIVISHHKAGGHQLHYEVDGNMVIDPKNATIHELFQPIIEPGRLRIKAINFLLKQDSTKAKNIIVEWGQKPPALPYFVSLSPEATLNSTLTVPKADFDNLIFFYGDDLRIKKFKVRGNPYYEIVSARDTINDMETSLQPFFSTFFPRSYDFWQDKKPNTYFLFSAPFYTPGQTVNTGFAAGNHGFVMIYQGKYTLNNTMIVAHETSHKWIGGELRIKDEGERYTWFSEGVNDYITYYLLAGTGMMGKEDFVAEANKNRFEALYKNPVNGLHTDSLAKHFWDGYNYIQISYQRGFLYGFVLDNQIRLAWGGKKTIRDFLIALLAKERADHEGQLTYQDYLNVGAQFLPKRQLMADIEEYMIQGKLYDLSKIKLINGFHFTYHNNIPSLSIDSSVNIKETYKW
ncbi:hypothetical protein D0C36_18495 [Mucilaginibacter conchicola]|uniref:Peptidase M1 membrane alanine aminopeptidase domain-containing protein n=1 Tax=Mucilaginibacter conchicola TaxID=2303333 RepID=A0A372NPR6_9SPHI|nr:hypothetical protein [Mucilaginibacter conchicola]RFZ90936.1 hypothetical protein D0C36_18495 [Mucilaginibacter conchicola]